MPQVANYIRSQPDILIVDALLQGRINGLAVAQELRDAGLDLPIIALTVPQKPLKIGEGMGATEVLSMPFSGYDFMRLLQDMHDAQRARAPESLSRVYLFFGAKGGVGTTTLAYNVAASIVALHYRVALIDGSLQFGDLAAYCAQRRTCPRSSNCRRRTSSAPISNRSCIVIARESKCSLHH